jgi:L-alanine-DL-glutamate epimerase-like enolase superfamily enzyme
VRGGKPLIRDGFITVPEKPGIGLELDEDETSKHIIEADEDFFVE